MADTLIREGVAYGSQPLSPVPQYWDGAGDYEKAQGVNGAIRVINYDTAGETFTDASPGSVTVVSSAGGTAVLNSGNPGIVEIVLSAGGSAVFSNTTPGTVQIVTSAGATNLFSGSNPGSVQLTATSTVNFSGSGTVAITGTATVNFSGSGTVDILTVPVVGTHGNAFNGNVSAGATSNIIDLRYNYNISYFGQVTNTATLTMHYQASQDGISFFTVESHTFTAGSSSPFHYSLTSAARYAWLLITGVSANVIATIAGK